MDNQNVHCGFAPDEAVRQDFDASRYAQLVACGHIDLLLTLPPGQLEAVIYLVRKNAERQLTRHIARCIAAELTECPRNERKNR